MSTKDRGSIWPYVLLSFCLLLSHTFLGLWRSPEQPLQPRFEPFIDPEIPLLGDSVADAVAPEEVWKKSASKNSIKSDSVKDEIVAPYASAVERLPLQLEITTTLAPVHASLVATSSATVESEGMLIEGAARSEIEMNQPELEDPTKQVPCLRQ